jgi:protein-S-isoprenylcysteine O-methyltransferase Ste14
MWALQLATTIAFSSWIWWGLVPISTAIYYVGTMIRVRREENLLREQFGPAFDDYARRVPALLPFGSRRRSGHASGANA